MRGYFAVGVEGLSKPMNAGNLLRSAHAFGAHFFFIIDPDPRVQAMYADTSRAKDNIPVYLWPKADDMHLPGGCALVGVELTEDAVDLPSFHHPRQAAYILGPERGSLSPALQARCAHIVKIPTRFCINVATAGAIVMYDRMRALGGFPDRPLHEFGPIAPKTHKHGQRFSRRRKAVGAQGE